MNVATQTATLAGRHLPSGWHVRERRDDGAAYLSDSGLSVIESIATERDGKRWHHVSVARPDRMPSWDDLTMAKRIWLGHDTTALQVIPATSRYVNIHPYCLHLWRCLDGDVTPDFTRGGRSI